MGNVPNWIAVQGFQLLLLWKLLGFKVINMLLKTVLKKLLPLIEWWRLQILWWLKTIWGMSIEIFTQLASITASSIDLKRIWTVHSLLREFWADNFFTNLWSGGIIQVWVQVWDLQKLFQKTLDCSDCKMNGRALGLHSLSGSDGQAQTQGVSLLQAAAAAHNLLALGWGTGTLAILTWFKSQKGRCLMVYYFFGLWWWFCLIIFWQQLNISSFVGLSVKIRHWDKSGCF